MDLMVQNRIAVIVPAYKPDFLGRTLESIAAQTSSSFRVYIGDDCSKYEVKSIVDKYSAKMDLQYERFDTNVGGRDLVAQWERCVRQSDEEWIWMFSDDDVMPSDGVERVLGAIGSHPEMKFFRFPLQVVDENDTTIFAAPPFEEEISSSDEYLLNYFAGRRPSAACEYVFHRSLFESLGMVHFPCAWCSDIATWFSYAEKSGGMVNLSGAPVSWRNATGVNISNSTGLEEQKMEALIQFISWLKINRRRPFGKALKKATRDYIETILSESLVYRYTISALRHLSLEFFPISPDRARRLYFKFKKKRKL